jgi:CRP-like cAMP-binding protein
MEALALQAAALSVGRHDLEERLAGILSGCRADTIAALAESARLREVRKGGIVYAQGEPVTLTLILEGYAIARRSMSDGHELMSGVAPAGVVFGWSSAADASSSVGMIAITTCTVAQWPGQIVRRLVVADGGFALAAIDSMAASLHTAIEQIQGFMHQDGRRRVLRILGRHRDLFFADPPILNRTHLPGLVGTTPEMTRRVLRQLEQEGTLVRVGRSGLRLLHPERLAGD